MHARIEGARSRRSCKNVERTKFYFQLEHAYWKVEARRLERRGQSHFLAFFRSRGRPARRLRAFIQGRKTSRCLENAPTGRPPPPLSLSSPYFLFKFIRYPDTNAYCPTIASPRLEQRLEWFTFSP